MRGARAKLLSSQHFSASFGTIKRFKQRGTPQTYFLEVPADAVVLAVNNSNRPVSVYDTATQDTS